MVYKYDSQNDNWETGKKVSFPDGTVISKDNKIEKSGWFWSDEAPRGYAEWLNKQENI